MEFIKKNSFYIILLVISGGFIFWFCYNTEISDSIGKPTWRDELAFLWERRKDSTATEITSSSFVGIVDSIYRNDAETRVEYDVILSLKENSGVDFTKNYYPYLRTNTERQQITIRIPNYNIHPHLEESGEPIQEIMIGDKIENEKGSLEFVVFVGNTDELRYKFELFTHWSKYYPSGSSQE
jgi:hypothetical protein